MEVNVFMTSEHQIVFYANVLARLGWRSGAKIRNFKFLVDKHCEAGASNWLVVGRHSQEELPQ